MLIVINKINQKLIINRICKQINMKKNDKDNELKFLNTSNSIILVLMWGTYILLIVLRVLSINNLIEFTLIDFISLFAALSAITGILYSNFKSDERNEKNLKNSNKQLIEQFTRDKKENSIFILLENILKILNKELKKSNIHWIITGENIKESFEESQRENEHCYTEFNLFAQNELYYYFKEIMNNPKLFNYIPITIQKEIKNFNNKYYEVYQKFFLYLLIKFEGSLDLIDKFNTQEFEYTIIDKDYRPQNYLNYGNYLIKDVIDSYLFNPDYYNSEYIPEGKETVIVKIDKSDEEELEYLINKITYLTYNESLKYGYEEF